MPLADSSMHDVVLVVVAIIYGACNLAGTIYAANRSKNASNIAGDVKASVGESNGKTLAELAKENHQALTKLTEHDLYTHDRNHDIISLLVHVSIGNHLIGQHFGIEIPPAKDPREEPNGPGITVR